MKGIIFDVVGVIQPYSIANAAKQFNTTTYKYMQAVFNGKKNDWHQYETGVMTSSEFGAVVLKTLKMEITEKNLKMVSLSLENLLCPPDQRMVEIIKKIRPGIMKAILSNSCPEFEASAHSFDNTPLEYLSLMDKEFWSHKIGLIKPDERVYLYASSKMLLTPSDCFFIDDKDENIRAAEHAGFEVFTYTTPKVLDKILAPYFQ